MKDRLLFAASRSSLRRGAGAFLAFSMLGAGCAGAPVSSGDGRSDSPALDQDDEVSSTGEQGLTAAGRTRRVARLKQRIRTIALANMERTDNLDAVAAQLTPLVRTLVSLAPAQTPDEQLALLDGPWHNLWSNLGYGPFPPDLTRIYQVVTSEGHYYNLSQATFGPPGSPTTINALRGAYAPVPGGFAIRFTSNGFLSGSLSGRTGSGLLALASGIESGTTSLAPFPGGQSSPGGPSGSRGPIGITGKLTTLYVDDDFRISGGEQTPVFDDKGVVSVPGQFDLLFVLDRQVGAVP